MPDKNNKDGPRFTLGIARRLIKYTFCCNVLFILLTSLLFLFYGQVTQNNNPCDGLVSTDKSSPLYGGTDNETSIYGSLAVRCRRQSEYRGYASTQSLVDAGLMPASATYQFTSTATSGKDFEDNGKHFICRYFPGRDTDVGSVTNPGRCEPYMTGGSSATANTRAQNEDADGNLLNECWSEQRDENPLHRINVHGADGKCLITRVPEICKETGFSPATDEGMQKLIDAQDRAEITLIGVYVVTVLAILSFLNYFYAVFDLITCGFVGALCRYGSYGECMGLNFTMVYKCVATLPVLEYVCYGENDKREGAKDAETSKLESGTIYFSNLVHNALLLTAGFIFYFGVNEVYEEHCYNASYTNVPRPRLPDSNGNYPAAVTFTGSAQDYLKSGPQDLDLLGDARITIEGYVTLKSLLEASWVINTSLAAVAIVAFTISRSNTADMDNMKFDIGHDGTVFGTIKAIVAALSCIGGEDMSIGEDGSSSETRALVKKQYRAVPQNDNYHRRTVQLRGQF